MFNLFIFIGAYGEVRRAIHKKTGQERAVKIINKSSTTKEDQEKLINEVNILRELVILYFYIFMVLIFLFIYDNLYVFHKIAYFFF